MEILIDLDGSTDDLATDKLDLDASTGKFRIDWY